MNLIKFSIVLLICFLAQDANGGLFGSTRKKSDYVKKFIERWSQQSYTFPKIYPRVVRFFESIKNERKADPSQSLILEVFKNVETTIADGLYRRDYASLQSSMNYLISDSPEDCSVHKFKAAIALMNEIFVLEGQLPGIDQGHPLLSEEYKSDKYGYLYEFFTNYFTRKARTCYPYAQRNQDKFLSDEKNLKAINDMDASLKQISTISNLLSRKIDDERLYRIALKRERFGGWANGDFSQCRTLIEESSSSIGIRILAMAFTPSDVDENHEFDDITSKKLLEYTRLCYGDLAYMYKLQD